MHVLAVGSIVSGPCSVVLYHIRTSRLCSPGNPISAMHWLRHFQSTHLELAGGRVSGMDYGKRARREFGKPFIPCGNSYCAFNFGGCYSLNEALSGFWSALDG